MPFWALATRERELEAETCDYGSEFRDNDFLTCIGAALRPHYLGPRAGIVSLASPHIATQTSDVALESKCEILRVVASVLQASNVIQDSDAGLNENSTPWLTGPSARDDLRENGALDAVLSSVTLLANGRGDITQAPRRTGDCRILHHRRRNSPLTCPVWPALDVVLSFCRLLEVAALHRKPFRQCDGGFGSLTEQYREPGDGKKGETTEAPAVTTPIQSHGKDSALEKQGKTEGMSKDYGVDYCMYYVGGCCRTDQGYQSGRESLDKGTDGSRSEGDH
ncbi:uncharacterized protein CLUP02_07379 [Colletotrichum lupini]|uniref:Uncharacterized protein n=1 Tax=Colletotrichum lupini TaxID=145971 RepID=A0A9Q8WFL7_9PEZI|nr:uncharacterized protein CLUP02_07379 [Colletotrichum lupini]UQC81893.1 hypothetical protein CLUP02_07379 [Colletotrichum lupini]